MKIDLSIVIDVNVHTGQFGYWLCVIGFMNEPKIETVLLSFISLKMII